MVFASYFTMHKTTMRTLICLLGVPSQYYALASFLHRGVLSPTIHWPSMLCVLVLSACGVMLGQHLHSRIDTALALRLLLGCISVAGISMLSKDWSARAAAVVGLAALAASARFGRCSPRVWARAYLRACRSGVASVGSCC